MMDIKEDQQEGTNTNEVLELHKLVIIKFKRRKIYVRFKDVIWAADLAEMDHYLKRIKQN